MNTNRSKRFLENKFGPNRFNGNGIARLLEEYRTWVDPTEDKVEMVRLHAEKEGLISSSRKANLVDRRTYLYVYLTVYKKMKRSQLGRMFNKDHASILHCLKTYANGRYADSKFLIHTIDEREEFYMDTKSTVVKLSKILKSSPAVVRQVKSLASKEKHDSVVSVIDAIIDKYNLKDKYTGDEDVFRKSLIVKVLDGIGWTHTMIADKLKYRSTSVICERVRSANNITYRNRYSNVVNEFKIEFDKIGIEI